MKKQKRFLTAQKNRMRTTAGFIFAGIFLIMLGSSCSSSHKIYFEEEGSCSSSNTFNWTVGSSSYNTTLSSLSSSSPWTSPTYTVKSGTKVEIWYSNPACNGIYVVIYEDGSPWRDNSSCGQCLVSGTI